MTTNDWRDDASCIYVDPELFYPLTYSIERIAEP